MSYNYLNLSKTMKTIQKTMGWLVMAAALTIGTTACSSDDMLAESNEPAVVPQAPQKVHITVGAGVGNSEEMRSAVDYNSGTKERTLKFTAGDKLYVRAVIEQAHDDNLWGGTNYESKIMAGFMTIDPASISADGKSAQFMGDLDVYQGVVTYVSEYDDYDLVYNAGSHTFSTDEPLAECVIANAQLVHEGSASNFSIDDRNYEGYYDEYPVKSSVNEIMTSYMWVNGSYDIGNHKFALSCNDAVFNFTVSGLTPNNSYALRLLTGSTADVNDAYSPFDGTVTADASGKATFVISTYVRNIYMKLLLVNANGMGERKQVTMGQKDLEAKVYNITCTATDYVIPNFPTVTGAVIFPIASDHNIFIEEDPADVTISGSFTGFTFYIENSGTVRLNNVTGSYDYDNVIAGESTERDLTVVLTGDNSLSTTENFYVLYSNKNIKLSCTGSSATLTLRAQPAVVCGINCTNYDGSEPNDLAADGYTVALTNTVNGPDSDSDGNPDYYTWTYTVTKN